MFEGKTCLITGGTGSWGHELTRKLIRSHPREIRIFSRNEFAQVQMERLFAHEPTLRFYIGDVRDAAAVRAVCENVDYVFHLAALKHVPICEMQPDEALKTNLQGTQNIIAASMAAGVEKVVDVSTDKAVEPINFYGMTKALGEKLMIQANQHSERTRFVCIRAGNVLGTNGSVVPFFKRQLLAGEDITLTHPGMTRFFLTLDDAIDLLLEAAAVSIGGETLVIRMKACRILDLAHVMAKHLNVDVVRVREIGIRPGEKLHEVLVSRYESAHTYPYGEKYYVILPDIVSTELRNRYQASQSPVAFREYSSRSPLMNHRQIEQLLRVGGLL